MIRNQKEYKEAKKRVEKDIEIMNKQRSELKKLSLKKKEIDKAMEPMQSFHDQLKEEVSWYENVKKLKFDSIHNLNAIGTQLIGLRIASGLTQSDLAKCLNVTVAQVSKDERNEYHGISINRAQKIFDVFGVTLNSSINIPKGFKKEMILEAQ